MPSFYYPGEEPDGATELQEKVLGLLEDAGLPTETNDAVMKLIDGAERRLEDRG